MTTQARQAPESGCEKARRELEEYIHGELCAEDASDIREHLDGCGECRDEHTVGVTLSNALKGACKENAPEQLRDRILDAIREAQAHHG